MTQLFFGLMTHATPPPNFLIMLADDMGWGDWSRTGSPGRTPHLEAMSRADHTTWFQRAYSGNPPETTRLFGLQDAVDHFFGLGVVQAGAPLIHLYTGAFERLDGKLQLVLDPYAGRVRQLLEDAVKERQR